ncbi:MAG: hypothetical protein RL753_742 [Bacteroidota bacterium]
MMKNFLLFALLAAAFGGSAQRIHGYAKAKIAGQEAFQLNDSTEVFAERTERGFTVRKRVWVANSSLSGGVIMPGSSLFNERGEVIGQTLGADVTLMGAQPATERKLRKYQVGTVEGEVRATALQAGSWPEEALAELLNAKRSRPFWEDAEVFFKDYGFAELEATDLPEALADGGYKAFILMRRDASNQANPRFRILVVTRGESAVQSIVLEGSALELPKFKVVEKVDFGTIMHAQKPTPAYKEALEELAYRHMPL